MIRIGKLKKKKKTNLTTYYPVKPNFMSKTRNSVKIKRMEKDTANKKQNKQRKTK